MIGKMYSLLPPGLQGRIDYYLRFNSRTQLLGGPFNGQQFRQQMFKEIVEALPASAVIETGAFRGTTTEYMYQRSSLPTWTVEAHPRFYEFTKRRLGAYPAVTLSYGDSRAFLRALAEDPSVPKENVFFYLDAHWNKDLPLLEEIRIIAKSWRTVAVMIDDFCVADDPGYTFDDYGPGATLNLQYLTPASASWTPFYPKATASQESGKKRGSVVLVDADALGRVKSCDSLRAVPWPT
jgi:hypothetical protein